MNISLWDVIRLCKASKVKHRPLVHNKTHTLLTVTSLLEWHKARTFGSVLLWGPAPIMVLCHIHRPLGSNLHTQISDYEGLEQIGSSSQWDIHLKTMFIYTVCNVDLIWFLIMNKFGNRSNETAMDTVGNPNGLGYQQRKSANHKKNSNTEHEGKERQHRQ